MTFGCYNLESDADTSQLGAVSTSINVRRTGWVEGGAHVVVVAVQVDGLWWACSAQGQITLEQILCSWFYYFLLDYP